MKLLFYCGDEFYSAKKDTTRDIMIPKGIQLGHSIDISSDFFQEHFKLSSGETLSFDDLNQYDAIFLRRNPPFSEFRDLLEILNNKKLKPVLINSPNAILKDTKRFPLKNPYIDFCPETSLAKNIEDVRKFWESYGDFVLKPIDGFAGRDVYIHNSRESPRTDEIIKYLERIGSEDKEGEVIIQQYMPEASKGDSRLLIWRGEIITSYSRIPASSDGLCNVSRGAKIKFTTPNEEDYYVINGVKDALENEGVYLYSLDLIGGKLIEINMTSTGVRGDITRIFTGLEDLLESHVS